MSLFDVVNKFNAKATIRESKDEMLFGEIIRSMSRRGFVADTFTAGEAEQLVRFRAPADDLLKYLWVGLDQWAGTGRMTSKVVGARASVRLNGQIKLELTDPDDLVEVWRTSAANVLKMPMLGQLKLEHQVTTVGARMTSQINIDDYVLRGDEGTQAMLAFLDARLAEIREALAPYQRAVSA